MQDFKNLKVWEKGHKLTLAVYQATGSFPREEMYGLRGQIRRACVSIPANIAEGCGRRGDLDLARFFQIAMGSASELEYHLLLAHDLCFISDTDYQYLADEVVDIKRMLTSFMQKLTAEN